MEEERVTLRDELEAEETFIPILDIEQEFIDHLTDTESVVHFIREGFDVDLINTPNRKAIANFAFHYFRTNGTAPTPMVLRTEFPTIELYETQGSASFVVEKLRERYTRNEVQALTRELAKRSDSPTEALSYLRAKSLEIERGAASSIDEWGPDDTQYFMRQIQEKILSGQYRGKSFGFEEIDKFTGGAKPGYLAGISARPKRQKTFFWLQALLTQIYAGGNPIAFTLENTELEIWQRMSCMISGFSWDKMQRGEVMPGDWKRIEEAWDELKTYGNWTISRPPVGERSVPSLLLKADKAEADSVLVSQFKYIEPINDFYRADHEKWGSIVVDLKLAAITQGAERPWYVETQLNREAQSMTEMQDADLSQLGLTDMWGQACDIMFCLFQNRDLRASGLTEFGIIEARNSDKHSWLVQSEFKEGTELKIV